MTRQADSHAFLHCRLLPLCIRGMARYCLQVCKPIHGKTLDYPGLRVDWDPWELSTFTGVSNLRTYPI